MSSRICTSSPLPYNNPLLEADAARASVQTIHDTEGYAEAETEKYEWQYPLAALHVGQFFVMSLIQDLECITAVARFEEPVLCTIISSLRLAHVFAKFREQAGRPRSNRCRNARRGDHCICRVTRDRSITATAEFDDVSIWNARCVDRPSGAAIS
jgi:hypothetical protein